MTEAREDPEVAAWRGLLVAHSRLVPALEADLRAAGQISLSWYDVLLELNAAPGRRLRMSELGQRAVLSRTRVSRVVDELAAAGLAERQPDQADGRSSFAVLTPAGRNALRRAWPVYRQAIRRHLGARLTADQCRQLAALLEQAAAGANAGRPQRRTASATGAKLACACPWSVTPMQPRESPGSGDGPYLAGGKPGPWRKLARPPGDVLLDPGEIP